MMRREIKIRRTYSKTKLRKACRREINMTKDKLVREKGWRYIDVS